jgi:DNA-binding CsgD family transcriptional regulator
MGVLNASLGKLDKGIVYFNKALVLHQQLGDKDKIVTNLLNIGTACFFDNQLEKAKKYFFRALATTPKNNLDVRNILLMNIATIYQHTKQLDSAYYYQVLAIKSTEKINDEYILSTLYYNAATVKFEQHDLDSTNYYALKGLALASKLKKYDRQIGNLLMISQVDSVRGDLKGELSIFKRIVKIKDSILQQERESIADEMEVKYNNLKKDEIINLQNNNLKIANEKNRLFRVVIIISLLLLVISLVFAITLNKLLRKNKKIHQIEKSQMLLQLKEREKELVSIALQIEQKNRLIDTIYHKLKKTLQHPTSIEKELNNILIDVKISFNVQKDIAVFTEKFENLHHDFIAKLKNDYPELTIKEIKFLSFLKIGLSTKQVASIQNVTPAAVHKMRYRIKKKINLEKDVSLDDFVVQL